MIPEEIREKLRIIYKDDQIDEIKIFKKLSEDQIVELDESFSEYCKAKSHGYYDNLSYEPMGGDEFNDFIEYAQKKERLKGLRKDDMITAAATLYVPCIDAGTYSEQCNQISKYVYNDEDLKNEADEEYVEKKNHDRKAGESKNNVEAKNGATTVAENAAAKDAYDDLMANGANMSGQERFNAINTVVGNVYKNELKTRDICNLANYLTMSQRSTRRGQKLAKEFTKLAMEDIKLTKRLEQLRMDAKAAMTKELEDERDRHAKPDGEKNNVEVKASKPVEKNPFKAFASIFTALGHGIMPIGHKLKDAINENKDSKRDAEVVARQYGELIGGMDYSDKNIDDGLRKLVGAGVDMIDVVGKDMLDEKIISMDDDVGEDMFDEKIISMDDDEFDNPDDEKFEDDDEPLMDTDLGPEDDESPMNTNLEPKGDESSIDTNLESGNDEPSMDTDLGFEEDEFEEDEPSMDTDLGFEEDELLGDANLEFEDDALLKDADFESDDDESLMDTDLGSEDDESPMDTDLGSEDDEPPMDTDFESMDDEPTTEVDSQVNADTNIGSNDVINDVSIDENLYENVETLANVGSQAEKDLMEAVNSKDDDDDDEDDKSIEK